ncbi:MAG TPA: hypothetical protein VEF07_12585 [Candidatus Binataceae bacterium]|nr:hypothetical protein [Candidatus Binataceae bacterium]
MALKGTYDTLKQLFQDIIAPQLEKMSGEISGLKTEIRSLEKRMEEGFASSRNEMESLRGEMRQSHESLRGEIGSVRGEIGSVRGEIGSVRGEMESLRGEMRQGLAYTNKRLDEVLEIRERLAALEAKLANRN